MSSEIDKPIKALIDGDIFLYEFGSAKNEDGTPLAWPFVVSRMTARINNIVEAVGADSYQIYLTGQDNFRERVATIKPYKGNRPSDKPYWHQFLKDFLIYHREAIVVYGMEADDALGIAATDYCEDFVKVICSRDKDLRMIPGHHYTWGAGNQKEKLLWYQDAVGGLRSFYKQLLTGDTTDNIPGLYGVGPSSSYVKHIDTCGIEEDMYSFVKEQYVARFGSYWKVFMYENAHLLWILQTKDENEIIKRFEHLENR